MLAHMCLCYQAGGAMLSPPLLCHQAVLFGTGQEAVLPCGCKGNRRSGVALAMCHRLQWLIHLRAHGLRQGDKPTLLMGYGPLSITKQELLLQRTDRTTLCRPKSCQPLHHCRNKLYSKSTTNVFNEVTALRSTDV